MDCILLNTAKPPFNNPKVRLAAAKAAQLEGSTPRSSTSGSTRRPPACSSRAPPYYSRPRLPGLRPERRPSQLVQAGQAADRQAGVLRSWCRPTRPSSIRAAPVPPAAVPDRRHEGDRSAPSSRTTSSTTPWPAGFQALRVAPVRGGQPGHELHLLEHHHGERRRGSPSTWPATATPSWRRRCRPAVPAPTPTTRATAYQTVNERLAMDLPYLWNDRAVGPWWPSPTVQNFNNPTTPTAPRPTA